MSAKSKTKRGKDGARDTSPEPTPCTSYKSKKRRLSTDDEDDSGSPKRSSAHPTSKLGHNGLRSPTFTPHNKPAELFRKDLISAMKLADSEPLQQDYIFIADPWRQDWEKGVQVPVNPGEIPKIEVKQLYDKPTSGDFKIPRKYLHATQDETFRQGIHELTGMQQLSEQVVRYDLDDLDVTWLEMANEEREEMGLLPIHEWTMERVIEALEAHSHEEIKNIMKTEEGLGIEYDEDIVCEVCRSPDSEETNEMVFCDGCDICVHQACYGIQNIPEGRWLCRTCSLGIKPTCILCPRMGGAMKSTKSGTKWAHVSCALWIPEVSIGCVEKMEPITKISNIPASRWALVCCVCKDRVGACIQCSVKTCKTAFHVTCAIFNGLEMKTILDESDDGDGVKLKAFCPRHSKKRERSHSDSEQDSPRKEAPPTPRKDLSKEEVANLRAKKLAELQNSFYEVVDSHNVAEQLAVEEDVVELVMVFWKLKRKTNFNKPLLMPKTEEADMLEKQQEDSLVARMKMFVHLRQDLERVRNLCYMISRREKTKRQYYKARENTFFAAVRALTDEKLKLSQREAEKLAKKYKKNCLYEGYYSQEKPKVVSRLSFSEEGMLPSPQLCDDTESIDSDSRDVGVPFRGRLSSRDSATSTKCEREIDTASLNENSVSTSGKDEPESVEWKDELESVDEKDSYERTITSHSDKGNVDQAESTAKETYGKEKPDTVSSSIRPDRTVSSCDRSEGTVVDHSETLVKGNHERTSIPSDGALDHSTEKHGKDHRDTGTAEKHSRTSRKEHLETGNGELEKRVTEFPIKLEKLETVEPFEKVKVKKKGGRPRHHVKSVCEKTASDAKMQKHSNDLDEKPVVFEKRERIVGKYSYEKAAGKEKHERHLAKDSRIKGKEKDIPQECVKAEKEYVMVSGSGDANVSVCTGRERVRGREREKIKVEPDYENDFVDVMEVDPPVISANFHTNADTKLDVSMPALEKAKIEETPIFEVERPRRSLRENRQQIEMPKVDDSPTRHSSPEVTVVEEVKCLVRETKKQKHRRHGHRRHRRGEHRSSDRKRERTSSLSKERKVAEYVKSEVNGVLRKSKYVVENSVKERVQNKLLKSRRLRYINGAHDTSQQKIDRYFQTRSPEIVSNSNPTLSLRTSSRILNEISPDKKTPFENNLFGAHYTPKGSLSGYKIPKKGDSSERTPIKSHGSCEKVEEKESRSARRKGDSGVKRDIFADTGFDSLNTDSDFSKDVELVSDSRGYRSHSPLSSAGTDVSDHPRHSPSREGTPRRVTRSQHLDVDENSVDSVHSTRSNVKLRLNEGWIRPSKFSS